MRREYAGQERAGKSCWPVLIIYFLLISWCYGNVLAVCVNKTVYSQVMATGGVLAFVTAGLTSIRHVYAGRIMTGAVP